MLSSFQERCGGPFDYYFDEEKAKEIIKRLGPYLRRTKPGECSCEDDNCPHKGSINPLASVFLGDNLEKCLIPRKTFFEGMESMEYDKLEIVESEYHPDKKAYIGLDRLKGKNYNRQRIIFSMKGRKYDNDYPYIPRLFAEVVEGVELSNEMVEKVKYVVFEFNGQSLKVPSLGKQFVKCPFLIALKNLIFVNLRIYFLGENDVDLGYDFDSWIIGGVADFVQKNMDPIYVPYIDNGLQRYARYYNNVLGIGYRKVDNTYVWQADE